jgi:hypothetical protein
VRSGRGNLERALRGRLAAHVGEVGRAGVERTREWRLGRGRERPLAAQVGDGVVERGHRDDGQAAERRALHGVLGRQEQLAHVEAPRELGEGERAAHRPQRAVEPQLAAEEPAGDELRREVVVRDEQRHGDGEVEVVAFLAQVGRRETDDDRSRRQVVTAVPDGAAHALAALAHGGVGQAHELEPGQTEARVHLDLDRQRFDTPGSAGEDAGEHR